jgi:tetratricopeptide (TPR) repeat protein
VNPDELAELEEQRGFLVRSLDDLERELAAGDIDELDATTLRDDYTHRLGDVQRAIESGHIAIVEQAAPRRRGRAVVVTVVVAALAIGAGTIVAHTAGSRKPGESATGNIRESFATQIADAQSLMQQNKLVEALKAYDAVLKKDPQNVDALTGRGLTLVKASQAGGGAQLAAEGQRYIEQALAQQPNDAVTLFYLGIALWSQGKIDDAKTTIDKALANNPPASLRDQMQQFRDGLNTGP